MIVREFSGRCELAIDNNIFLSDINAKLYDICAFINYGNLDMPPYPIFDKIMQNLNKEILVDLTENDDLEDVIFEGDF